MWDLEEVEVSLSDSGRDVAKTNPKWCSDEDLPTALLKWPLPQRCGDKLVFQIIPRTVGISILSLDLSFSSSASNPFSVSSFRREIPGHCHYYRDISFSRGLVVYTNRDPRKKGGQRLVVCRPRWVTSVVPQTLRALDDGDDTSQLVLELVEHSIPFLPHSSLFDAFSSRVVFYDDSARFHVGSFVVTRSS